MWETIFQALGKQAVILLRYLTEPETEDKNRAEHIKQKLKHIVLLFLEIRVKFSTAFLL